MKTFKKLIMALSICSFFSFPVIECGRWCNIPIN
jgi:hypothetical protein